MRRGNRKSLGACNIVSVSVDLVFPENGSDEDNKEAVFALDPSYEEEKLMEGLVCVCTIAARPMAVTCLRRCSAEPCDR